MNNGELLVSVEALIRIFVFLLYVPVCLISYWQLIPRLSPISRRIATGFLAAQVLVIVIAVEIRPSSSFEWWLWRLDQEWNIPATLASTQLALVGGLALVTAWLAKARPVWQRLYLVGIGLLFLYLAHDEYAHLHEFIPNWINLYAALGATVVVATLVVTLRSPRYTWIWHTCLLIGLAMSASGALVIDGAFQVKCGGLGFLRFDECLSGFFLEEPLEFLGIWLVLVAMLGQLSDVLPAPSVRIRRILYALPPLWILLLFQSEAILPIATFVANTQPAAVEFESDVHLHGFRIEKKKNHRLHLHLYLSPGRWDFNGLGYSIHLVDQGSGDSIARGDQYANRQLEFLLGPGYVHIYRQWMELEIPPQAPVNRALWVVLTLWRKKGDEFVRQPVLASDLQLLDDTQVVLNELTVPALSTATPPTAPLAVFDNGFTLDAVDLPPRAQPGETLTIPFIWRSDAHGREDHGQFLHFGHQESGAWWVYDQQPLGSRLPTRLWYNGLADSEAWQVPLPADLAPGRYTIFTGLYRRRDLERVPASGADGTPWLDARVPLGSLTIGGA